MDYWVFLTSEYALETGIQTQNGFSAFGSFWRLHCLGIFIEPVGHEARYLRFFAGEIPQMGDTRLYPSLMLLVALVFSLSIITQPLIISCLFGSVLWFYSRNSIQAVSASSMALSFVMGSIPLIWGWSLSIYNIIIPFFFVILSIWYLVFNRPILTVLGAFGLAVFMRIELIIALPFLLGWIWTKKDWGWHFIASVIPVISMLSMFGGEIPGEGERWLSIQNNWFLWEYYRPFYWFLPLLVWRIVQKNSWNSYLWGGLVFLVINHIVMSSFNDFSSRHLLVSLIPAAFCSRTISSKEFFWGIFLLQVGSWLYFWQTFYADDEDFQQFKEEYSDLPHYSLEQTRQRGCAWVVEMEPFTVEAEQRIFLISIIEFERKRRLEKAIFVYRLVFHGTGLAMVIFGSARQRNSSSKIVRAKGNWHRPGQRTSMPVIFGK